MERSTSEAPGSLAFGRFRLLPHRRELLADGQPVKLGGRAFDVLMALVEARGAVLSKDALMARVWPGRIVEENALQSQISDLRAAFGADRDLIRTVSGRGYQFTGDIRVISGGPDERGPVDIAKPATALAPTNLPEPASELIGRDAVLGDILGLADMHRLVTLTGAGGIGKTRLALAAGRQLLPRFRDGVWLADFSPIADPGLVPVAVAVAVGLELGAFEVSASHVAQAVAEREVLIVLDTCEHVIAAVSALAEAVLGSGRRVRLLATSREPLEVEGEWVYPVHPLVVPAEAPEEQDDLPQSGAMQLFIERARAANPRFLPDRRAVTQVAAICRQLDGIPLAIEMAAARTSIFPVDEIATRLKDRFRLLTAGRRTALPRHQTLRAAFDWSYELLPEAERVIFRRLAIFAGPFGRDAATAIVASPPDLASWQIIEGLSSLVTKSLVVAEIDHRTQFRLLDTTRAYALEKLDASGEPDRLARSHAEYYRGLFEQAEIEWEAKSSADWLTEYGRHIDNLRAALDWAFSANGDKQIAIALTVAAVPLWIQLSLTEECRAHVERALAANDAQVDRHSRNEMKLRSAMGACLLYMRGDVPEIEASWRRALDLAEDLNDTEYQLQSLWGLWSFHMPCGQHDFALELANRFSALAANRADALDRLIGEQMIGMSQHYLGDQAAARRHIERVISDYAAPESISHIGRYQIDLGVMARVFLARILWLEGFQEQALRAAEVGIAEATTIKHATSLCYALALGACPIALLVGDLALAERYINALLNSSNKRALARWHSFGRSFRGLLMIRRGDTTRGLRLLQSGLNELGSARSGLLWLIKLFEADALTKAGQISEGLAAVEDAMEPCEHTGDRWRMAEMLRIKGELIFLQDTSRRESAEDHFRQALDWARRQGALSWELRAATSLARLLRDHGRSADALELLLPVYQRFTEGFDTPDLRTAKTLLEVLGNEDCRSQ